MKAIKSVIVNGLMFGDEGKGGVVDYLVRQTGARLVVRYNGGANAGHRVVLPGGQSHVFSQYGSGTFAGARTFLSRYVLWDPLALAAERRTLAPVAFSTQPGADAVLVDEAAPVITPWHRAVNRLRDGARGEARHGSCGVGLGELASDVAEGGFVIRARDLCSPDHLAALADIVRAAQVRKVEALGHTSGDIGFWPTAGEWVGRVVAEASRLFLTARWEDVARTYRDETVVFEGAQGVLLDEDFGFHPYTTWSRCTFANADALLDEVDCVERTRVGVLRAHLTRHGPGPFPSHVAAPPAGWMVGEHNARNAWQGEFRYGHFDGVLARYALAACGGADTLALTCLDRAAGIRMVAAYQSEAPYVPVSSRISPVTNGGLAYQERLTRWVETQHPLYAQDLGFVSWEVTPKTVEAFLDTPVGLLSRGPTHLDKALTADWPACEAARV